MEKVLPIKNIIIVILSVCLLAVISLFFYSEYQSSSQNKSSLTHNSNVGLSPSIVANEKISAPKTEAAQAADQQPDKSLPVPAHQLKKLIAESKNADALDKKIADANKAIAVIEQQLPTEQQNITNSEPDPEQQSTALDKRIQHIRNHLEKN